MVAEQETPVGEQPKSTGYLTVRQVAERLGITPGQVYDLCDRKAISYMRFGTRKGMRFTEEQVADFIKRSTVPATKK